MNTPTVTGQCEPISSLSGIKARLKESGVNNAMVIDDSLDAGPEQWRQLLSADRNRVFDFIEDNPDLGKWLEDVNLYPPESVSEDSAEHYLQKLKNRLSDNEHLRKLWDDIIEPSIGDAKREVEALIERLKDLGLEVHPSGIRYLNPPPEDVSVIFLDYALDNTDEDDPAAASIEEFNRIQNILGSSNKPIVVLMSGRTMLAPADEVRFRNDTGIMPGMFFRFQKDDLQGISLHLIMSGIAENRDKAVSLGSFIKAVSTASQTAANKVSSLVQGLTLEDFALIQMLSLNDDGHPLGEYVLWLTGVYFKQLLERSEDVRDIKQIVDRLVFTAPPLTEWGPSGSFLSAYRAAVFADADPEISSNGYLPLDERAKAKSGKQENIVTLHFGDIFVKEKDASPTAYIVLTPECDLVFGGSRPFPHRRTVILLPGNMSDDRPFKMPGDTATRSELLQWNEKDWRIQWRVKEAESVCLGNFRKWSKAMKLRRVARMEFSFASDIQRAFVGNLSRVGLPVVPPQFQPQNATIYVQGWNKGLLPLSGTIQNGAYLVSSPQLAQPKCILSDYVLIEIQKNLPRATELATQMPTEDELGNLPESQKEARKTGAKTRTESNATELRTFSESPEAIMALKGPHDLANLADEIELSYVTITSKAKISGSHAKTVLTIHLESPEENESSELPSETEESV